MFALYYISYDDDYCNCEIIAISTSREKLEEKRDAIIERVKQRQKAFNDESNRVKEEEEQIMEKAREFLKSNIDGLIPYYFALYRVEEEYYEAAICSGSAEKVMIAKSVSKKKTREEIEQELNNIHTTKLLEERLKKINQWFSPTNIEQLYFPWAIPDNIPKFVLPVFRTEILKIYSEVSHLSTNQDDYTIEEVEEI